MDIRPATLADTPDIQAIYAHHVLHGTGTFEEVPPSVEEMQDRFQKVTAHGWAWLVSTDATGVLGYAYYTQFRDRSAYRYTVENAIYVRDDVRGQGVGKALVQRLIDIATAAGFRQMIAVIGGAEPASEVIHARAGFTETGRMRSVGRKHGRWLDTLYMQRALGVGDGSPPDEKPQ